MLLYIHIPFCDSKCFYCAFNSYTTQHYLKESYIKSLKLELKEKLKMHNKQIETIFIGGGTPSCIDAIKYKEILDIIKPYIKTDIEITIEANPNSASLDWLKTIYSIGVNRVSFGVQSFDNDKLKFLGRNHNKQNALDAILNANKVGFNHINLDIIYDTKLDTKELLENDLKIIKTLQIDHISAYSLTIEEGTKFFNKSNVKIENINLANYLFEQLKDLGFEQYEISNFAKNKDARSKHNLGYWQYKEYLGIGCGAVGRVGNKRYYGFKDILEYNNKYFEYEEIEELSKEDILIEKVLLGFRSDVGVDINLLNKSQQDKIYELIDINKVMIQDNRVINLDFMLADELSLYIF